jgi:hypothetical protein
VAIKNEDIYVGMVYVNLDGTKSWLDLIVKLIKMKVDDCYTIKGVKKILLNEIEVKESNEIPNTNLDSITAVCVLNEFGVFFLKKILVEFIIIFFKWVISLLLCRIKLRRTTYGRRRIRNGRRRTMDGRTRTMDGRRRTMDGRRRTMDGRRRTMDGRRRTRNRYSTFFLFSFCSFFSSYFFFLNYL